MPKALRAARQPLDQHEHWVSPPVLAAFAAAWSAVCPRSTPTRRSQSGGVTSARNRMTCSLSDQRMRAVPRMSARAAGMHALTTPRPHEYRNATHIRACGGGVGSNCRKTRAAAHAGGISPLPSGRWAAAGKPILAAESLKKPFPARPAPRDPGGSTQNTFGTNVHMIA